MLTSWQCVRVLFSLLAQHFFCKIFNQIIVLDPAQKAAHIYRYWGEELLCKALKNAEQMV
jgi:hypothetical protein